MPAPPPLECDTIYHIWNRGVNHSVIFRHDENYRYFLNLYILHIEPVAGWPTSRYWPTKSARE